VDNASKDQLTKVYNIAWNPNGRQIREEELGLTAARLRGIQESVGELLVFVDDDNILQSDFLANVLGIANEFPFLGAWGGHVEAEFESSPPSWLKSHHNLLALKCVDSDYWSNYYADNRSMPVGAGLCLRRDVGLAYLKTVANRPASRNLGRKGASLISGEDVDMALTACDCGLGIGMFRRLRITHLIPSGRMTAEYICRLLEAVEYSTHLLKNQRDPGYTLRSESRAVEWIRAIQIWRLPEPLRAFARAQRKGWDKARTSISGQG